MAITITGGARRDRFTVDGNVLDRVGFPFNFEDQFTGTVIDSSRWNVRDNDSSYGHPTRIQTYRAANAIIGAGSTGATLGTSLRLRTTEIDAGSGTQPSFSPNTAGTRYSYSAAMLDTEGVQLYYPRYGRFEWRAKLPHGQGLWPSFWLTAKNGGATMCEMDIVEYFHSEVPGKNSSTIHGTDNTGTSHINRYTNNGAAGNGVGGRTFFEAPTYTPGWHIWACEIVPVTDSTGNTAADPTQPSGYVRLTVFLDNVQVWRVVDTSALWWTTNGGTADSFWNIFLQGCQVDGNNVGHPEDALGYSHWTNNCLISGVAGSCTVTTGGYTVQRARFVPPAADVEIDYFRHWKYTG